MTIKQLPDLSQFHGTEHWWRHLAGYTFTDGVRFVAVECGAYWLIDEIMFAQCHKSIRTNEMLQGIQFWTFVSKDGKGDLYCYEDSNRPPAYHKHIEFTDFPEGEVKFYFADGVLLLPSEY